MSTKPSRKKVAFSVINCICFDQRVQKIAETVSKLDCEITIIGRRRGDCCDSHEYFTGVPELNNKPFRKWFWKTIERSILPHLKYVMTVSDSISEQYEIEYKILKDKTGFLNLGGRISFIQNCHGRR